MGDGACSASIPGQNPVRKFDRGEIPPKHPVEKDGVVVGLLIIPLMADGEVVGDVEECPFVLLDEVVLENVPALFEHQGECDHGGALVVFGGRAAPKEGQSVADSTAGRLVGTCLLYTSPSPRD